MTRSKRTVLDKRVVWGGGTALALLLVMNMLFAYLLLRGKGAVPVPPPEPPPFVEVVPEVVSAAKLATKARAASLSKGYKELADRIDSAKPKHATDVQDEIGKVLVDSDAAASSEIHKVVKDLPDGELGEIERKKLEKFFRSLSVGFGEAAQ